MPTTRFFDRESELEALNNAYASPRAQLFVLYGHRRVGKTELIHQFCKNKPHIFFQAAAVADTDSLRRFLVEAGDAIGDTLLARSGYRDWEPPLEYLADRTRGQRLIVALDEFPYLCEANPALPSLIQRFWDQHGQHSDLFLILCGSSVSFMLDGVLAERSPLYGRRTGQIRLGPLGYRESAQFVSRYSLDDRLRVYGVAGGIPMYLGLFDDGVSVARNVQQHVLHQRGLLYEEPEYLLRMELRDPRTYNSILAAIAGGLTKHGEIAQRVDQRAGALTQYLSNLESLHLIRRVVSATERTPGKRSVGRYFIADNFLRFWYRFVLPNLSMLEIGEGARVWEQEVVPRLDEHMGLVFEGVCREYVRRYWSERLPVTPGGEVGVYWHKDAEIDVLARNEDGSHYCGECKWSRKAMDLRDLYEIERKAQTLPEDWRQGLRFLLFSRSGFTEELRAREDGEHLVLVDLMDLYGAAGEGKP